VFDFGDPVLESLNPSSSRTQSLNHPMARSLDRPMARFFQFDYNAGSGPVEMLRHLPSWIVIPGLLLAANLGAAADGQKDKPPATYSIPLPPRPDFSAFAWIIGDWAGYSTTPQAKKEAQGTVHLTLSYTLDKRFVLVNEEVSLPAGQDAPAQRESWMGFVSASPSGSGFVMRAFSSTGFITDYHVTITNTEVRFDPQGGPNPPPGWLFRRVITRLGPGYFGETVQVAPPGKEFFDYYTAKLTQVIEPKSSPPPFVPNSSGKPQLEFRLDL